MNRGVAVEDIVRESRRREGFDVNVLDGRIVEHALTYRLDLLADDDCRASSNGPKTARRIHCTETISPPDISAKRKGAISPPIFSGISTFERWFVAW